MQSHIALVLTFHESGPNLVLSIFLRRIAGLVQSALNRPTFGSEPKGFLNRRGDRAAVCRPRFGDVHLDGHGPCQLPAALIWSARTCFAIVKVKFAKADTGSLFGKAGRRWRSHSREQRP